jgi:hypothetical protein
MACDKPCFGGSDAVDPATVVPAVARTTVTAHYSAGKALMDPNPGFLTRMEARKLNRQPSTTNLQYLGFSLAGTDATSSVPGCSVTSTGGIRL